jgi:hypothetical protein
MNTERTLLAGVIGGLLHLVVVGGLYVYLYGPELFGYSATTNSFAPFGPTTVYVVVGAFLLGALPAVLLAERRLVTPALTVLAFVAGIVLMLPQGLEPRWKAAGPSDLAFYFLLWFVPLFVACVLGGIEALVRHLTETTSALDASPGRE